MRRSNISKIVGVVKAGQMLQTDIQRVSYRTFCFAGSKIEKRRRRRRKCIPWHCTNLGPSTITSIIIARSFPAHWTNSSGYSQSALHHALSKDTICEYGLAFQPPELKGNVPTRRGVLHSCLESHVFRLASTCWSIPNTCCY